MTIGVRTSAVVLAGGGSVRMGVPKHGLLLGDRTLLEVVVSACAGCDPIVVVGPPTVMTSLSGAKVVRAMEDPPGGGPCAGLAAGMACVPTEVEWAQVLTCDLPRAPEVMAALDRVDPPDAAEGVVAVDSQGWPQFLCGRYRAAALRRVLASDVRDRSVRRVFGNLTRHEIRLPDEVLADVDDPAAAARAGLRLP